MKSVLDEKQIKKTSCEIDQLVYHSKYNLNILHSLLAYSSDSLDVNNDSFDTIEDIIKNTVTASFNRGQDNQVSELIKVCDEHGFNYNKKEKVERNCMMCNKLFPFMINCMPRVATPIIANHVCIASIFAKMVRNFTFSAISILKIHDNICMHSFLFNKLNSKYLSFFLQSFFWDEKQHALDMSQ